MERVLFVCTHNAGRSQIAQALFITMRTVSAHLGHAYAKLDIADRAQLSATLSEGRLHMAERQTM